ncbi:MAG TPA: heme ABC exporter ATP-binding protein CcmA [Thermomicrobiales bacterium]|nr:heme ABC exporter ATP-binding protein CcmA [Thermomicrobiales bacterium]
MTSSNVQAEAAFIQLSNVYKRFGARVVLRDVSFALAGGEAIALLGANGAGKTTVLRLAATLTRPTRGNVMAFGVDAWAERRQVRARIGIVAHQPYVYRELTCRENLWFFATMFNVADRERVVSAALERVGLTERAGQRAGELSRGLLQRLNIARATLHEPAALILDEPDTGLDAVGREALSSVMRGQVDRGGSLLFTTHSLELALLVATRVVVIREGRIELDANAKHIVGADVAEMMIDAAESVEA